MDTSPDTFIQMVIWKVKWICFDLTDIWDSTKRGLIPHWRGISHIPWEWHYPAKSAESRKQWPEIDDCQFLNDMETFGAHVVDEILLAVAGPYGEIGYIVPSGASPGAGVRRALTAKDISAPILRAATIKMLKEVYDAKDRTYSPEEIETIAFTDLHSKWGNKSAQVAKWHADSGRMSNEDLAELQSRVTPDGVVVKSLGLDTLPATRKN